MKTKIADLNPIELRVFAEIAYASKDGICNVPITVMRRRCELSTHRYKKTLDSLESKNLISQEIISYGVPRRIELHHG